jgi:hypothetical protein
MSSGDANNAAPVRDWRGKVVGYRDIEAAQSEGLEWITCSKKNGRSSAGRRSHRRGMLPNQRPPATSWMKGALIW